MSILRAAPTPSTTVAPGWVSAAPFRAWLRHLVNSTAVPWPIIAHQAGVSRHVARTLLFGRAGRVRPRLDRTSALALVKLTEIKLHRWSRQPVPAKPTRERIHYWRQSGWPDHQIAVWLGSDVLRLEDWAGGRSSTCPALVDARARLLLPRLQSAG